MKTKWSVVAVMTVATIMGFLLQSPGPIGKMIWPLKEGMPQPEGGALAALMLMGALEALAFGVGVVFLVFGWNWIKRVTTNRTNTILVYVATAWLLVNWVPHTSLHMTHGNINVPADYWGLVAIEYGFHLTLIIAGCIIAAFFVRTLRNAAAMSAPQKAATPTSSAKTA